MANRRPQHNNGRRMDFGRNDRIKNFERPGVSPWQGGGPGGAGLPSLLGGGSTEATLALASNIINLLQPRQNPVPSLLDMPIRRDFGPAMGRFDRGYPPNRMGNQNFRCTGNYNRYGERVGNNRKPFRPNDRPRQQNKREAKPVKESEEVKKEQNAEKEVKEDDGSTETKKEAPKTRYDDICAALLKCHICNKNMWDGRSFENHLSGRAHAIMMQKTAESYALTADTMRQEFKIREMKRTRKTGQQTARDFYCAMCDMYASDGAGHRTTAGHRKLKKYLHPSCTCCHKETPTRIELDEHRLSAEHMRTLQDKKEVDPKPKPEVMVISTLTMEQSYLRNMRRRDDNSEQDKDGEKDGPEVKKEMEDGEEVKTDEEKKEVDQENTILDYMEGDDLSNTTVDQFPSYNNERAVGRSFLSEFRCVQCKLCKKLLDTEETAEVHLKTWRHHQLFLRLLHEKTEQKEPEQEATTDNNKRPLEDQDSGNWKRRKVTSEDGNDGEINGHDGVNVKDEPQSEGDGLTEENDEEAPPADDLEDWGTGDDANGGDNDEPEPAEEPQEEPEVVEPEPEPSPPPVVAPAPRGRARRSRGRRY